jgi:hypothetical protein
MVDYTKPIAESNRFIVLDKYTQEWKVAESYQSEGRNMIRLAPRDKQSLGSHS